MHTYIIMAGRERASILLLCQIIFLFNRSEYIFLKTLLDPDQDNPEIDVIKLANTLHKYSESQKAKVDLDER